MTDSTTATPRRHGPLAAERVTTGPVAAEPITEPDGGGPARTGGPHRPSRVRPLAGLAVLVVAVGAWELGVRLTDTPEWIVPSVTDVVTALIEGAPSLAPAALVTLGEATAGLALGTTTGLLLAVVITFFRHLEQAVLSIALLAKSTPVIAVAPILTIWLGFGAAPKVLVTALLTFFPMLVNALEGFRSLDPEIEDWFDSVDADPVTVFRHARWPTSWPYLFAALKVSAPLAMIGAVVAEWMGASSGLGRSMWLAYTNLRMPALFAAVLVLTALSALVYHLVTRIERRALAWRS